MKEVIIITSASIECEITATVTSCCEPLIGVDISIDVYGHELSTGRVCLRIEDGKWVPNEDSYITPGLRAFVKMADDPTLSLDWAIRDAAIRAVEARKLDDV